MRIVFTVSNDLNYDQRMIRVCNTLQHAGYDCLLVGRVKHESIQLKKTDYLQKRINCIFQKGKWFYIEFNIRLLLYLVFSKWDAVCSIDLDTAIPGVWACKLKKQKHIFDAHELFTDVPEVARRPKIRSMWLRVQAYVFRNTGMAYTVGSELASWFQKEYGKEVAVIRNAPRLSRQLPYTPDTDRFILYQGALNEGRGLEKLLLAMKRIPCKLVLAGEGDISANLKKQVIELEIADNVQFLGFVLPADLPALTARAWIGVNVSENAGLSYYLSLNNKFFDYVHAGLPAITNAFPEYIALNKEFEVGLMANADVEELEEKLNLLLYSDEIHNKLHLNCMKAMQEWNWEKEGEKLVSLYQNYLGK
jgi:glycosyltransferase involved in cell wall biosynthesis